MVCLEFWILDIRICFEFRASSFEFSKERTMQKIMQIQLVTF